MCMLIESAPTKLYIVLKALICCVDNIITMNHILSLSTRLFACFCNYNNWGVFCDLEVNARSVWQDS